MRQIEIKYNLIRNGGYLGEIRALQETAPILRMDAGGSIKTGLSGQFARLGRDADGRPVEYDLLSDEIQPVLCIDGTEHPLGIYSVAKPSDVDDGPLASVSVQAYDRCWRVRDTRSAAVWYWPAGTLYLDAVEQLLTAAGITTIIKTQSSAVFAEAREDWPLGESHLTIINQLLREINYKSLYFDGNGAAVLEPATEPEAAAVRHVVYAWTAKEPPEAAELRAIQRKNPEAIFAQAQITRTTDVFEAPNRWIVTCANPDKTALMVATSQNDNAQSPLSIPRRGREITRLVSVNNIPNQIELQAYADRLRNESLTTGETLELTTMLDPGWGAENGVMLFLNGEGSICVSRGYEMELQPGGLMRHRMERVVYNLDV